MKERADVLLVNRKLCDSRTQAQALLLAGRVYVGERRIEKPGTQLDISVELTVRGTSAYVSRGGNKLAGALEDLKLNPAGMVCLDVGASTGGFTDCLLQQGARKVYAVDVGHAQLADKLRRDSRVVVREGVNARYLTASDFDENIEWIVVDASFIGIEKLVDAFAQIAVKGTVLLALIKPQFEAGRDAVRKGKGVITDPKVRQLAIDNAVNCVLGHGFTYIAQCDCRVPGPKGNVEHFLLAKRNDVKIEL